MLPNGNTMERVRADLIRRARLERHGDLEQGLPEIVEGERSQNYSGRLAGLSRPPIPRFFGRRDEATSSQEVGVGPPEEVLESPKSPEFSVRPGRSPLNRFTLPNMSQIWPGRFLGRNSQTEPDPVDATRPIPPNTETWEMPLPPASVTHARSTARTASSHYSTGEGIGPSGINSSSRHREDRQRRRRRRRQRHEGTRHVRRKRRAKRPTRFLFCLPWVKSRRMRSYILRCFVSGLFLVALLSICEFLHPSVLLLVLGQES